MHGLRHVLHTAILLVAVATPCSGQAPGRASRFLSPIKPTVEPVNSQGPLTEAGRAFLASVLLPGAGQALLGLGRWVPYAALEGWGWLLYLDRRADGREQEKRYRDLAWSVARRISAGPRRDGEFEYYEALTRFAASGAFDLDPRRPGTQPETDARSFNGQVWELARALFFRGADSLATDAPEYEQALRYYEGRAASPEFAWAWGENGLEQQSYRELIRQSDEALRDATRTLGLILANHIVSAVDALVAARLKGARGAAAPIQIESGIQRDRNGMRWTVVLVMPWPGGSLARIP
ncbi:MAG: hypothetical protein HY703_02460 [Gemmatimonadetes bacterium]|nr:hypothetical protein [Gemmatimonadota bacterium]